MADPRAFDLSIEIDSDYDDPARFEVEIKRAIWNNEDVTIDIAGQSFHVAAKGMRS